jgi:hypothetical protein
MTEEERQAARERRRSGEGFGPQRRDRGPGVGRRGSGGPGGGRQRGPGPQSGGAPAGA